MTSFLRGNSANGIGVSPKKNPGLNAAPASELRKQLSVSSPVDSGSRRLSEDDSFLSSAHTPTTKSMGDSRGNSPSGEQGGDVNPEPKDEQPLSSNCQSDPGCEKASPGQLSRAPTTPGKSKKMNGFHSVVDQNKTKISGTWKDSILHGHAELLFASGASFVGNFKDGLMDGHGIWKGAAGESYVGEWKNSYTHGKGEFTWSGGNKYNGDWHWGTMWGNGKFSSMDGTLYEGQFAEGRRHGAGKIRFPNGDEQYAIWYCDTKWITYAYKYANGDVYNRNGATKFSLDDKEPQRAKPPPPPKPEPSLNPPKI